jgi:hypothetical protein
MPCGGVIWILQDYTSWQGISTQKLAFQIAMKSPCYSVFNHSGTWEQKFFWTHSSNLRLTRNCPWTNSVTTFTSLISTLPRPHGEHRLYGWCHLLSRSVFTEPLLKNGLHKQLLGAYNIEITASSTVACWFTKTWPRFSWFCSFTRGEYQYNVSN